MRKAKVIKSRRSDYPDPLIIKQSQKLRIEKKESEWPGWTWCIDDDGKAGWVPSSYLKITGKTAEAINGYDAAELTVKPGDELKLIDEEAGWYWCRDLHGNQGWVPAECISVID
ncbi:MAG: hypothetical protein GWO41_09205 [candidate division Zixibacteria bacterium]|nr:hypothetical protein [candidate division Zixibacteria bacterium]NIR67556.1 hypothetical protein [candidate division Zixibacteria bacterium]NIS16526.1 hypothetical protein [candidate division Zixibacteria bacterium]NIS48816.1 hypothetical protein [candidate division Zixibacteria bacterium]NIT52895.1 hypothetical protein [candidate division Zixibacteria bacterium]